MARDVNRELLALAAFSEEEIEEILPRWQHTAEKLHLTEEIVAESVDSYIPAHWDIKYLGVRKLIGVYLREMMEVIATPEYKKKGVKIVYGILPAIANYYYAMKKAGGDNVYIGFPDLMLVNTLNSFFHGAAPFLYEAEKCGFTYGCRHCPLNKMRVAAYVTDTIADPDIIWSWGFNCDEGPKTDEFIQCLTGRPWNYHVSRVPHDSRSDEVDADIESRLKFMCEQMKLGVKVVGDTIGYEITDEHVAAANKDMRQFGFKMGMLMQLATTANPPVIGGEAISLMQQIMSVPFNTGLTYMTDAVDTLLKELCAAVKSGEGVMPKDTPRLAYKNLPYCVPWIGRCFRENGVILQFAMTLSQTKAQMEPTSYPDDPWMAAAESWARGGMGQNMVGDNRSMIEKIQMYKPDGMMFGLFDFDRWVGPPHKLGAKIIQEETGVPCYYIEGDFWDDRDYSYEAMKTRIESICQIIKIRKAQQS